MSRVSLSKRLSIVRSAIRAHDPLGCAVHDLPACERRWYDEWREECDRITAKFVNAYEAMLHGELETPPMPEPVARLLGTVQRRTTFPADTPFDVIERAYTEMLDPGAQR